MLIQFNQESKLELQTILNTKSKKIRMNKKSLLMDQAKSPQEYLQIKMVIQIWI